MAIMDKESDAVMMLMDLGAYEKMLDRSAGVEKLTEEELLEKINRDVAVWRAYNEKETPDIYDETLENRPRADRTENALSQAITPEKPVFMEKGDEIKIEQEEPAVDIATEEEEEKFYLEPVE